MAKSNQHGKRKKKHKTRNAAGKPNAKTFARKKFASRNAANEKPDFHVLYETSVQSPEYHVELYGDIFERLRGARALRLREDFSGTFALSTEWVRSHPRRRALAIDLDLHALASGMQRHWEPLKPSQKSRLRWVQADVRTVSRPGSDVIAVGNFSHFIFHTRAALIEYFRAARKSLAPGRGILVMETPGGPGFICRTNERERFKALGRKWLYTWEQREFNPINREGRYAIHFKDLGTGRRYPNTFEYHWRVWTLPELRDAVLDAGFSDCQIFWETRHEGQPTGEVLPSTEGDNSFNWIAYVVGIR